MKKFYLLVLIYLFIGNSVCSAKDAERAVYVYLSGLEDSQVFNKRYYAPIEVIKGDSIKLKAVFDGGEAGNNYYLWQRSRDGENWEIINAYWLEDNEYEGIVYYEGLMYYRVVVSSENFTYKNFYEVDINCETCTISSPIEITSKTLELNHEILTQRPCYIGKQLVIRLYVQNPLSREVENVKVAFDYDYWRPIKLSAIDENSGFDESMPLWNVGTMQAGETKTVDLRVGSSLSYVSFRAYIASVDNLKWSSCNYASQQIQIEKELKVNNDAFYLSGFEYCGTLESDTLEFASYFNIDKNIIKFYEDAEKQKEVIGVDISEPRDGEKYYAVFVDKDGCESEVIDFKVKINQAPKLVKVEPVDTILCNANGGIQTKVTINYKIEGGGAPYYIYYTCSSLEDFGYEYETNVMVNSDEGSFDLYLTSSAEYKITYISDRNNCSANQEVPTFRVYLPKTNNYYLSTTFDYKLKGEDYVVSIEDNNAEFDAYQWQVSYDNGNTFEDLIDTVNPNDTINVVSGAQTTELKISNLGPQSSMLKYRVKLLNSAFPCFVYYSKPASLSMQSTEGLALRVLYEYVYMDYICEGEMIELICEFSNNIVESKKNLKVKLDVSDSLEELTVVPSVGEYDDSTKIWTIDQLEEYSHQNITVSFRAKENERITFSLLSVDGDDSIDLSTSIDVNVLKAPIIGELQAPEPICEGEALSADVPSIQGDAQLMGVVWFLDGSPIGLGNYLSREEDGAILQCEVSNMCGTTLSNGVEIKVKGIPRIVEKYTSRGRLCEGEPLDIPAPEVLTNGCVIKSEGWLLEGEPYIEGTPIAANSKGYCEVMYEIEGECGGKQLSWSYVYNVARNVVISELKAPEPICDNSILYLQVPMMTVGTTDIVSEKWILDGEEYKDEELSFEKNGAKLYYEVVQSCNGTESVLRSNEVEITVLPPVEIADIPDVYDVEEGEVLQLQTPEIEYGIEPNDYVKYQASWKLLDEYGHVVMDDYEGQNITSEGEDLKLVYTIRPVIYMSPESYFFCDTQYSNVSQILRPMITSLPVIEAENDESILPTAITPYNENGLNDIFAEGMKVMIFDSRYQQIFEGDNGWDGTSNMGMGTKNRIQPPGVYYYRVVLPNGEKKVGIVEIVRM